MKKTIYQLACFLQEENDNYAMSTEELNENAELMQEEVRNLLTEKIGKAAAEDKLNNLTTALYDQGYINGIRAGAQLIRLLNGEPDTTKTTERRNAE